MYKFILYPRLILFNKIQIKHIFLNKMKSRIHESYTRVPNEQPSICDGQTSDTAAVGELHLYTP